ncbi:uncharacterized protein LOC104884230 [Beta vulgaris subsp. vulgaris]|uniref:uncharacterized protein LOC104884230 n=1 Tax=Beta vulgaris subsp. vulgaris TaxID=3555 RepID=UPI002549777C|nr:uncharacterized protein LOC104884230 [Beta vulgaris subsp. vulgaris]
MEIALLIWMVLLLHINLLHGLKATLSQDEKIMVRRRLELINKPAIKSFLTRYGDILDCVEINKQLAFDHPSLRNHSIQMKGNLKIPKQTNSIDRSLKILKPSHIVPKSMRCPRGTVPIKRIQEEDLAMEKFSSKISTSISSKSIKTQDDLPPGHQIATLVAFANNVGASGLINVWSPEVTNEQLSDTSVFVASDDGFVSNAISAGWAVNPYLYQNLTRLFGYWTRDSGKSTGCFNTICPGFVQVSQKIALGATIQPISTYWGAQYFISITIQQDQNTKNWWLLYGNEQVGYWPKELFGTLSNGATRAGWGGEISSPSTEATPGMGSSHFPEEGYSKACIICKLKLVGQENFPNGTDLKLAQSKPDCYKAMYGGDVGGDFGHHMFVGGPPNCKF